MTDKAEVNDVLKELHGVFEGLDIRWFLFGAQAHNVWGRSRATVDVDVTVELTIGKSEPLVQAIENRGFKLRIDEDVEEFVAISRVLPFVHLETGIPVDVVVAEPGFEGVFMKRARDVKFGDIDIPVVAPEDLIVMKVLASRDKDILDIQSVLTERLDDLDLDLIRTHLANLEESLGQSDLLRVFEAEVERAQQIRQAGKRVFGSSSEGDQEKR